MPAAASEYPLGVKPIGYLGPEGTFSQAALLALLQSQGQDMVTQAFGSVTSALQAVRDGQAQAALVPIENSVEGSVPATLDELASGDPLMIAAEITLPVQFHVWVRPGTRIEDIKRITTHPHAQAQCRRWLHEAMPDAEVIPAMSTASAAAAVADEHLFDAAIAAPWAGQRLGLEAAAQDIADNPDAMTRFVLVAPQGEPPAPTAADKTTLVLFMREDHPGALLEILTEFSVRGVNLTRIESRPTKKVMGDYFFTVDCEGHVADARVGEALAGLHRLCAQVRFLGSYARHDGKAPVIRPGTTNAAFAESAQWLDSIRGT
jgi:prephenate dehydratase